MNDRRQVRGMVCGFTISSSSSSSDGTSACCRSELSTLPGWSEAQECNAARCDRCAWWRLGDGPGPPCASKGAFSQGTAFGHAALPLNSSTSALAGSWTSVMPRLTVVTPMGPAQGRYTQCADGGPRARTPGSKVHRAARGAGGLLTIIQIEHQHPDARYPRVVAGGSGERARSAQSRRSAEAPAEAHSVGAACAQP